MYMKSMSKLTALVLSIIMITAWLSIGTSAYEVSEDGTVSIMTTSGTGFFKSGTWANSSGAKNADDSTPTYHSSTAGSYATYTPNASDIVPNSKYIIYFWNTNNSASITNAKFTVNHVDSEGNNVSTPLLVDQTKNANTWMPLRVAPFILKGDGTDSVRIDRVAGDAAVTRAGSVKFVPFTTVSDITISNIYSSVAASLDTEGSTFRATGTWETSKTAISHDGTASTIFTRDTNAVAKFIPYYLNGYYNVSYYTPSPISSSDTMAQITIKHNGIVEQTVTLDQKDANVNAKWVQINTEPLKFVGETADEYLQVTRINENIEETTRVGAARFVRVDYPDSVVVTDAKMEMEQQDSYNAVDSIDQQGSYRFSFKVNGRGLTSNRKIMAFVAKYDKSTKQMIDIRRTEVTVDVDDYLAKSTEAFTASSGDNAKYKLIIVDDFASFKPLIPVLEK